MGCVRHAVTAFVVCLFAGVGLMAFAVAGAQGEWKVGQPPTPILGHKSGDFFLLTSVGAVKVEIKCELLEIEDAEIQEPLESHSTLLFSKNCVTILVLKTNSNCAPLEPIIAKVRTNLILHNSKTYVLVEPLEGGSFATLHLGSGACAIGLNFPISGSAVAECTEIACEAAAVNHEVSAVLPGLFAAHKPQFGLNEASFHGSINLHLGGIYEGVSWSGVG